MKRVHIKFRTVATHNRILDSERMQQDFFSALATLQLLRFIYATKAHPRTAILVQTIIVGLIDLLHFALLFCVLVGGYIALGHAQFGWYRPEFKVRAFSILVFMSDEIEWSNVIELCRKSFRRFWSTFLRSILPIATAV